MSVPDDSVAAKNAFNELKGKIQAACHSFSTALGADRERLVESGEWMLPNNYAPAWNLYRFHRDRVPSLRAKPASNVQASETKGKGAILSAMERESESIMRDIYDESYFGAPMIAFYFSALDSFMEVAFAFREKRPCSYQAFREMDWQSRFKAMFPVDSDARLKPLYEGLYRVKRAFRDPLVHGMNDGRTVLMQIPKFGTIPLTLDDHERQRHFGWLPISAEAVREANANEAFVGFEEWLDQQTFFKMVRRYARTPFPIPMGGARLKELREQMSTPERFDAFLDVEEHRWEDSVNWEGRR